MRELPNCTIIIADTLNYGEAVFALEKCLEQVKPARTIWFTDIDYDSQGRFDVVKIPKIKSKKEYSYWMMAELGKQDIKTSHILVVQNDGYILDA